MPQIFDWPFLNEPIYRWFIFTIVMIMFLVAWGDILRFMKKAATV